MRLEFLQQLADALALNAEATQALIEAQQQAAAAQQAIAQTLAALATATGESESPWLDKHQLATLLNCSHRSFERWRDEWVDGAHYKLSGKEYLYNGPLCLHWRLNRDDERAHQAEVERWILEQQRAS